MNSLAPCKVIELSWKVLTVLCDLKMARGVSSNYRKCFSILCSVLCCCAETWNITSNRLWFGMWWVGPCGSLQMGLLQKGVHLSSMFSIHVSGYLHVRFCEIYLNRTFSMHVGFVNSESTFFCLWSLIVFGSLRFN